MNVGPEMVAGAFMTCVGGVWAWLGTRSKNRVDLVQIAQDAAAKVINNLTDQLDRQAAQIDELHTRCASLEKQDAQCRADLAKVRLEVSAIRNRRP